MSFKRFEILILLQLILIAATAFISAWAFLQDYLRVSGLYFMGLLILEIIGLYLFLIRQNKNLISFLEGLVHRDEYSKLEESGSRKEIHKLLNQIAKSYSTVKIEKESEHQYLLNTVKHVNIGLISFSRSGEIELFNTALEELLKLKAPKKLDTLSRISPNLPEVLKKIQSGNPFLYKFNLNGKFLQLSISATSFKLQDKEVKLVSMQDISKELQQEEVEIWQKLIRVLTHEIMNSAGPITSLSSTLISLMNESENISPENKEKMNKGLEAIEKRSKGLAKFVETYRSLTKVPEPKLSSFKIKYLTDQITLLKNPELSVKNISISSVIKPPNLSIEADEKLISQVLINIINNAIEVLDDNKTDEHHIEISAGKNIHNRPYISIKNNGPVIPEEILDKVFVPFFTTKENGNGIGLSLSRQIMQKHGGNIEISSSEVAGTEVILEF